MPKLTTPVLNWREIPFVRLLLPFIMGISVANQLNTNIVFNNIFFAILLLLLVLINVKVKTFQFRWAFGVILGLFISILGFCRYQSHNELNDKNHFKKHISEQNTIIGVVKNTPVADEWTKVEIEVSQIDSIKCTGNILLYLENDSLRNFVKYGDILVANAKIKDIEAPKNPYAFDFRNYLHTQNIHYQSFIKEEKYKRLAEGYGNPLWAKSVAAQQWCTDVLKKHLKTIDEYAVGAALVIGYRSEIPDEILNSYIATGAMHVLSVSGLHVGFLAAMLIALFNCLPFQHKIWKIFKTFLIISLIWAFAFITGASSSVLRAAMMFSFLILGNELNRYNNIYNTLALSAFFLLLYNPFFLFDVGFQLSYIAVAGLVYFYRKIYTLWIPNNKILDYFWQLTCVGVAAQITTLPLSFYYFHQFPTYFWLSGWGVVLLSAVALYAGVALFIFNSVPILNNFIGMILYYSVLLMNKMLYLIQQLPISIIQGIWVTFLVMIVLYIIIFNIIIFINIKKIKWLFSALIIFALLSISYSFTSIYQYKNCQIIIYNSYKNTIIDCIDGRKAYSITNEKIAEKKIKFAAQNYRYALGINDLQHFFMKDSLYENTIFYQKQYLQFYNKKIAIVNATTPLPSTKMLIDYVLICGNPKIKIEDITAHFDTKNIIVDASNSTWRIENWQNDAQSFGLNVIDVAKNGAFILDLKTNKQ